MTDEGRVVLLDFGLVEEACATSDAQGTPAYMAPERFAGIASTRSDWYAFGCILREALWGYGASQPRPHAQRPRDPLDQLVDRLLDANPARRPRAAEISRALPLPKAGEP